MFILICNTAVKYNNYCQMPIVNRCHRSVFRGKPPSMKKDMVKQDNTGFHLSFRGAKAWNELPKSITDATSLTNFKDGAY